MNKRFLAGAVFGIMLAAGDVGAQVFVRVPPPPPMNGAIIGRPPGRGYVWTAGYYRWHHGRYVWVPGRWMRAPRPGAVWIAPAWRPSRGGYVFVPGYWR
jgi:hypothetical protein